MSCRLDVTWVIKGRSGVGQSALEHQLAVQNLYYNGSTIKVVAMPLTCIGGPLGCETSRLPHFLDSQLTDSGEVVSFMFRLPSYPQEDSWYSFLLEAESTPGPRYG
jgi:hypothetical protein